MFNYACAYTLLQECTCILVALVVHLVWGLIIHDDWNGLLTAWVHDTLLLDWMSREPQNTQHLSYPREKETI